MMNSGYMNGGGGYPSADSVDYDRGYDRGFHHQGFGQEQQQQHFDRSSVNPYAEQRPDGRSASSKVGVFLHLANAALLVSGAGGDPFQAAGGISAMLSAYKDRRRARREADEARFQCPECGAMFGTYSEAKSHGEREHQLAPSEPQGGMADAAAGGGGFVCPSFECAACGMRFSDVVEAVRHADLSHGPPQLPPPLPPPSRPPPGPVEMPASYRCSICGAAYGTYEDTARCAVTHAQQRPRPQRPQQQGPAPVYFPPPASGAYAPSSATNAHAQQAEVNAQAAAPSAPGFAPPGGYEQQRRRQQPSHSYSFSTSGYGRAPRPTDQGFGASNHGAPPHRPQPPHSYSLPSSSHGRAARELGASNRGAPPPSAATTVRTRTRRTTHADGSVTVAEESVRADGTTVRRTMRYPAPPPLPEAGPKRPPPPPDPYDEVPVAECAWAEPSGG